MTSINIIIPYFGKLPNYFVFWLESVRFNQTIDFTIITDDKTNYNYPPNVYVHYCTFKDIQEKIRCKFNSGIEIRKKYKLCDFKPTYGYIFDEFVEGYDFWGFCDIDLIFGNIRQFIPESLLKKYSRIFSYGHLTLIKNEKKYNEAFMQDVDGCLNYRDVFSVDYPCYFDECFHSGTTTDIWKALFSGEIYENNNCIDDILIPLRHCRLNFVEANHPDRNKGLYYSFNQGILERRYYKNGKRVIEKSLYVHLQKRQMQIRTKDPTKFLIVPNKFISYKEKIPHLLQRIYTRERVLQQYENRLIDKLHIIKIHMQHLRDIYYRYFRVPYTTWLMRKHIHIMNTDDTINYILQHKCSVSRYGDGEFFVMDGGCQGFQSYDKKLADKLRYVLENPIESHLSCIPQCFTDTSMMVKRAQRFWRYFVAIHYKMIMQYINKKERYGDALVTRFYMDYEDKSLCKERFNRLKTLWSNKDILIVEGEKTRSGVGNDIFNNAQSIRRILGPAENAFDKYDDILFAVRRNASENTLILMSLGLTATVMAYDLAKLGLWAIDLGHLDVEYEWMKMSATEKVPLPYRYVNEAANQGGNIVVECNDEKYLSEIIERVL